MTCGDLGSGGAGGTKREADLTAARARASTQPCKRRIPGPPRSAMPGIVVFLLALVASVLAASTVPAAAAGAVPDGFEDEVVIDDLDFPTTLDWLPDGRVLVAEKSGRLWMYDSVADNNPRLFADL